MSVLVPSVAALEPVLLLPTIDEHQAPCVDPVLVARPPGPAARDVRPLLLAGVQANAPVGVEEASTGRLFALARQADPTVRARDAGERAIVDWLAEKIQGTDQTVMVVYENGRVPRIIANQGMDADIDVVTTRAFLQLARRAGTTLRAADCWKRIVTAAPTASDVQSTTMHRRGRP